jgi:peptidoglycan/LPS O-acetylase OafA/YrhL
MLPSTAYLFCGGMLLAVRSTHRKTVGTLAATICLATLSYLLVERPALRLSHREKLLRSALPEKLLAPSEALAEPSD